MKLLRWLVAALLTLVLSFILLRASAIGDYTQQRAALEKSRCSPA